MGDNTTMDPRRLREETRAEHEATEAVMPVGGETLTLDIYVRTLKTLYPLIASWETWAAETAPLDLRPLLEARRRSHLLAGDLHVLEGVIATGSSEGVDWSAVVGRPAMDGVQADFFAHFVGALYVMEGSTLGGRYIARHVEAKLGFTPGQGNSYFQGHGEATGSMWREIMAVVAAVPEAFSPLVVEGAKRTFHAFGAALHAGLDLSETAHG